MLSTTIELEPLSGEIRFSGKEQGQKCLAVSYRVRSHEGGHVMLADDVSLDATYGRLSLWAGDGLGGLSDASITFRELDRETLSDGNHYFVNATVDRQTVQELLGMLRRGHMPKAIMVSVDGLELRNEPSFEVSYEPPKGQQGRVTDVEFTIVPAEEAEAKTSLDPVSVIGRIVVAVVKGALAAVLVLMALVLVYLGLPTHTRLEMTPTGGALEVYFDSWLGLLAFLWIAAWGARYWFIRWAREKVGNLSVDEVRSQAIEVPRPPDDALDDPEKRVTRAHYGNADELRYEIWRWRDAQHARTLRFLLWQIGLFLIAPVFAIALMSP